MNSGRTFTEPRSAEVNIQPLFTEIEKNNIIVLVIYTGSDLNNIFRRKPLKIDLRMVPTIVSAHTFCASRKTWFKRALGLTLTQST